MRRRCKNVGLVQKERIDGRICKVGERCGQGQDANGVRRVAPSRSRQKYNNKVPENPCKSLPKSQIQSITWALQKSPANFSGVPGTDQVTLWTAPIAKYQSQPRRYNPSWESLSASGGTAMRSHQPHLHGAAECRPDGPCPQSPKITTNVETFLHIRPPGRDELAQEITRDMYEMVLQPRLVTIGTDRRLRTVSRRSRHHTSLFSTCHRPRKPRSTAQSTWLEKAASLLPSASVTLGPAFGVVVLLQSRQSQHRLPFLSALRKAVKNYGNRCGMCRNDIRCDNMILTRAITRTVPKLQRSSRPISQFKLADFFEKLHGLTMDLWVRQPTIPDRRVEPRRWWAKTCRDLTIGSIQGKQGTESNIAPTGTGRLPRANGWVR